MKLLTPKQVAETLGCKLSTVYAYAYRGILPAFRVGSLLRFEEGELQEFLKSCKIKPFRRGFSQPKRPLKEIDGIVRKAIISIETGNS